MSLCKLTVKTGKVAFYNDNKYRNVCFRPTSLRLTFTIEPNFMIKRYIVIMRFFIHTVNRYLQRAQGHLARKSFTRKIFNLDS